jgi:chemotaxis protein methyltransferase CheR
MALSAHDFDYVRRLVYDRAAIVLDNGKEYLVESRLAPVARQQGFASLEHLVRELRRGPFNGLHRKVIEAMTTNETSFFRDFHPFEALRKDVLPDLLRVRRPDRQLNIWCAACSTGQEPYSIAMLLREHFPELGSWKVRIVASDLSEEVLARARAGSYSQLEVNRGLPAAMLVKYFIRHGSEWQLRDEIRNMVEIRPINLVEPWPVLPPLDLVFVRNVLIYFDVEAKKGVLRGVRRVLRPDGYMLLGNAESTLSLDPSFEWATVAGTGIYRLKSTATAR